MSGPSGQWLPVRLAGAEVMRGVPAQMPGAFSSCFGLRRTLDASALSIRFKKRPRANVSPREQTLSQASHSGPCPSRSLLHHEAPVSQERPAPRAQTTLSPQQRRTDKLEIAFALFRARYPPWRTARVIGHPLPIGIAFPCKAKSGSGAASKTESPPRKSNDPRCRATTRPGRKRWGRSRQSPKRAFSSASQPSASSSASSESSASRRAVSPSGTTSA